MVGLHYRLDGHKFEQALGVGDREAWRAAVHGVAEWCPTLSDPMDCSLPSSSVHGIFQARVLEWGAIAGKIEGRSRRG